jgi:hypothetical protein
MAARNDDYCGNFQYRIKTSLNHFARLAARLDILDLVEIVIADWNSDEKIGDVLDLSPEARRISKFVYVRPEIARNYNPPKKNFNTCLSANASIRRGSGRYIMYMPCDIIFSEAGLGNLIRLLQGRVEVLFDPEKTLMLVCRKFIPSEFITREPDIEEIERFLTYNSWRCKDAPYFPGVNAHMGALIMCRDLWNMTGGMNEALTKWGWSDVELGLRVNQIHRSICLNHFGISCYEMDIAPDVRNESQQDKNPCTVSKTVHSNESDWGLGNLNLEMYAAPPVLPVDNIKHRASISKRKLLEDFPDIARIGYLFYGVGPKILTDTEWPSAYMLAFCAQYLAPQYFLDFSILRGVASLAVPLVYPCVDYIAINECKADEADGDLIFPFVELLGYKAQFRGHLHFVTGDEDTALQRLLDSIRITDSFDLVYFLPDLYPETCISRLTTIIKRVSRNGAIVFTSGSRDLFSSIVEQVEGLFPHFVLLKSYKYRTAALVLSIDQSINDADFDPSCEELRINGVLECWRNLFFETSKQPVSGTIQR